MKKIALDISQIVHGTGVFTYTKNLLENLLTIDHTNKYILFGGSFRKMGSLHAFKNSLPGSPEGRFFPIPPTVLDFLWNTLHFPPIEVFTGSVDVCHSSDWSQPPSRAFKVTTIHDLSPILLPQFTHPKIVQVHTRRLYWVTQEVDRVIVPSQASKDDLVKLGLAAGKIVVIHEAVDPQFTKASPEEVKRVKAKYRIFGEYVLGVGVNKRKNTQRLIEAFEKGKSKDMKLVLIGHAVGIKEARNVIFTGHVPGSDVPALYTGSQALIYPSLSEGFGLPILEAFACETPVVTSTISSMPEVAGEAAILVDPYDTNAIADGITEALTKRSELVKKGNVRLKDFSWKKAAQETLAVYQEAETSRV